MLVRRSLIIVYKNASTLSAKPFSKSSNPNVPTCLPFCLGDKLHNCFSMCAQGPHYPVPPFWFCNRVNIFPQYSAFEWLQSFDFYVKWCETPLMLAALLVEFRVKSQKTNIKTKLNRAISTPGLAKGNKINKNNNLKKGPFSVHWSMKKVFTFDCKFCIDFSNVFGGALWWLHRMATALLALL